MSHRSPASCAAQLLKVTPHRPRRFVSRSASRLETKLPSTARPAPRRKANSQQLPLLPLVFIFCLGAGSFHFLAKSREGVTHQTYTAGDKAPADKKEWPGRRKELDPQDAGTRGASSAAKMPVIPENTAALEAPKRSQPLFAEGTGEGEALVIFVLGGPGAGKGTQCSNLVRDYAFKHLSAGDLLREEQDRPGSEFGEMIKTYIKEGQIVPMEVTIQLLENAMNATIKEHGNRKFLIDGFPRKMDQAEKFEQVVVKSKFTLFFDCPEETMRERLLNRGKTSGRADDNEESIKKRFKTFVEQSMPVVQHFEKEGRVVKVDARPEPTAVYQDVQKQLEARGVHKSSQ